MVNVCSRHAPRAVTAPETRSDSKTNAANKPRCQRGYGTRSMPATWRSKPRAAFTLVELLVVIAIIGILVAILLPAVQAAREAARRVQCQNNLKQLSLGVLRHLEVTGRFPTGGWGYWWVGDPDRGSNRRQPGGWMYNILPYIEQENIHQQGTDQQPEVFTPGQLAGANFVTHTPLPIINCPSRRAARTYPKPVDGTFVAYNAARNPDASEGNVSARGDYAINAGNQWENEFFPGPNHLAPDNWSGWNSTLILTGISFERSELSRAAVRDGTSNTIMLGEKYLMPKNYFSGEDNADNETWCTGFNNDNHRVGAAGPMPDRNGVSNSYLFGSAHAGSLNLSLCDGSVRGFSYSIDATIFSHLTHRSDGYAIDASKF